MGADQLVVDRYRIEREIAHGGMGVILRAYDTRLNRVVALKMLRPDATRDTQLRNRLAAEARTASGLNHPGIATVFDFVEQGDESFIVYEYVAGYTLREELARARFTTAEILNAGVQLVDAVSAAHNHGITHRDLKPENVMFVRENSRRHVKILDFGLAKHGHPPPLSRTLENSSETVSIETVPGLLAGTVSYMAPEQLEGQPTDARTDIFALGLVGCPGDTYSMIELHL